MYFIYTKSKSFYLWDSSPESQCPCSLSSFKEPPFNLKLVFKNTTTKEKQPCKTVADNMHNNTIIIHNLQYLPENF